MSVLDWWPMDPLPPPLNDQAIAEAWLSVFGVTSFLDGGKISVNPAAAGKVQRLAGDIRYKLRRFLAGEKTGPAPEIPEINFREVADALFEEATPEELSQRLTNFPESMLPGITIAAGKGLEYLRQALPVTRIAKSPLETDYRDPSPRDADAFERKFAVADDLPLAFDLLGAGRLSGDQVEAIATIYPALYEHAVNEIPSLLVDVFGDKGKIDMPAARERQLQVFMRNENLSDALVSAIAAASADLAKEPKGQGGSMPTGKMPSMFDAASDAVAR